MKTDVEEDIMLIGFHYMYVYKGSLRSQFNNVFVSSVYWTVYVCSCGNLNKVYLTILLSTFVFLRIFVCFRYL